MTRRVHSFVCLGVALSLLVSSCRTPPPAAPPRGRDPSPIAIMPAVHGARPTVAFDAASRRGKVSVVAKVGRPPATTLPPSLLSAAETAALVARMSPLPSVAEANATAPSMRPPSARPPRTRDLAPIAFTVVTGNPVADGPLDKRPTPPRAIAALAPPLVTPSATVVRRASTIQLRFEKPMVPVATLSSAPIPKIEIAPKVAGTWRWVDTRLLQFQPKDARLPNATEYTVTVPVGLAAVSGARLVEPAITTFSTSPTAIEAIYPTLVRPDAPIAIAFDQAVDPAAIAASLGVGDLAGKQRYPVKLVSLADAQVAWALDPTKRFDPAKAEATLGKHHVIVAPVGTWPAGQPARVRLAEQAPSREGPLKSTVVSTLDFEVVEPFVVKGIDCGDQPTRSSNVRCPVEERMALALSNPLEPTTYRPERVYVVGEPPPAKHHQHHQHHRTITLYSPSVVGRTYTLRIDDGLRDIYGQPLTGPRQLAFRTVAAPRRDRSSLEGYIVATPTGMHTLDPRFEIPQWIVHASEVDTLRVELFSVQPQDYFKLEAVIEDPKRPPFGRRMFVKSYQVGTEHAADLRVDLRPALGTSGTGHVLAVATGIETRAGKRSEAREVAWLQVTKLGLSSRIDREQIHTWAHDITPTRMFTPIAGVTTSLVVAGRPDVTRSAATTAEGFTSLPLLAPRRGASFRRHEPTALLVATSATDSAFMPVDVHEKAIREREALWYATDDRFTYKPGEQVFVKGWIRWTHDGVNPDLSLPRPNEPLTWTLRDARGNRLGSGTTKLTDQGGFDLAATIPPNANLGTAMFSLAVKDSSTSLWIRIEEFRTPAFEVTLDDDVTHGGRAPVFLGDAVTMAAEASYFTGGGLPGADIEWAATLQPTRFTPAGWTDFSFLRPRVDDDDSEAGEMTLQGKLDARSTSTVDVAISALPAAATSRLSVDAVVVDVDRQRIRASSRSIVVHASSRYVGITKRKDAATGVGVFEMIVTDVDGKPVAGVPIDVTVVGEPYATRKGVPPVLDKHACKVTSADQPVRCKYKKLPRHHYEGVARIADDRGRPATARYASYYETDDSDDDLRIVPDRDVYTPGDIAKLELRSKTLPATAIVTFARRGVVGRKRVELKTPSVIIELPIELGYVQNIHVQVDRYRPLAPDDPDRKVKTPLPGYDRTVAIDLPVDPDGARLAIATRPTKAVVEPGETATFEVDVMHAGKPKANAEVALIVVDDAILSVSAKRHDDPLVAFLQEVEAGTDHASSIDTIHDAGDDVAGAPGFDRYESFGRGFGTGSGYGVGAGRGGMQGRTASAPTVKTGSSKVAAREDFRPNALFAPRLRTDANGRATATVKMPDSLTRYRIIALATADTKLFGIGESAIVAQRKVSARTVAPRFLTQGDRFEVPVVVQNLDRVAHTVDVAIRAANLASVGATGKRVTLPPGQRAEVRFAFATQEHGRAVIQTLVAAGAYADSSNVEVPIHRPATTESFATYGIVDAAPQFEQLAVPADILHDVGGIEVELASSQVQSLTDAFWYLHAYPYECFEQRSSRMLATSAMYDLLGAFATSGRPTRKQIDAQRALDARVLQRDQRSDGGWGYFQGMKSDPMVSLQVLAALGAQKITGEVTRRAIAFGTQLVDGKLAELEKIAAGTGVSRTLDERRVTVSLAALGLSALAATPRFDAVSRAEALHAIATKLGAYPVDAQARLLAVLARNDRAKATRAKLVAALVSTTQQTAASATVATSYVEAERLLLVSTTKTTALVLDALIREAPTHALVPKLARGILDARKHGRWRTTQENMAVMQAMRRYFDVYEKQTPNYVGKLWIGDAAYTERKFVGRDRSQAQAHAPWTVMTPGLVHDLALVKTGPGRMYYRVGITYAPKRTDLPALDAGFIVRREYSSFGDPGDVQQLADGTWKVKLGAKVLVTVETTTTANRHAVAIVDPLPAGFETINTRLATAERGLATSGRWDHENLRDNRSEAFAMAMASGTHRFQYVARATTPGTFIASPAKAEEMYSPETFGRSKGTVVVVE